MQANLIKAKMAEKNMRQFELADELGMSANSLSRKLSGKREFTIAEATAMCEILGLSNPADIFFDTIVADMQRNA